MHATSVCSLPGKLVEMLRQRAGREFRAAELDEVRERRREPTLGVKKCTPMPPTLGATRDV